ncbi:hypothetical protein VNO77_44372 [Canavalia gladiata]|uniref:Uncharacterized protein n=1 Tax=Canavalia gladiata TaxID=3824 RepID=A0AAN9JWL9_CANGL
MICSSKINKMTSFSPNAFSSLLMGPRDPVLNCRSYLSFTHKNSAAFIFNTNLKFLVDQFNTSVRSLLIPNSSL